MKNKLTIIAITITTILHAQSSWQWAKEGGSGDILNSPMEGVYSIVTDSQKNVYILSNIGNESLQIDGHPKQGFDKISNPRDIMFASFACDGSYRWSKVIGGFRAESAMIQIDSQDNIYLAGGFSSCDPPYWFDPTQYYPPRIENDFIIPQTDTNRDCRLMFLAKYNTNGVLQWIKRPEPARNDYNSPGEAGVLGLQTDSAGNSYLMVIASQGVYSEVFTNNLTNQNIGGNYTWFIFKYDTNGNFVSGTPLDIQSNNCSPSKFFRNPNTGNFYITGERRSGTITIGGQSLTKCLFLSCFNSSGVFQWTKEDTVANNNVSNITLHSMAFDAQNNMYLGMRVDGNSVDSFLGFSISQFNQRNTVIKVTPNADNLIWSTYETSMTSVAGDNAHGDLKINGNILAFTNIGGNSPGGSYNWGGQTVSANSQRVLLAQFNKDTGACLDLKLLDNNTTGPTLDRGMSLAFDASGDILLGGSFQNALVMGNGSQILNNGSVETDFFIAKYAPQACAPLVTEQFENHDKKLFLVPNPAIDKVAVQYEFKDVFSSKTIEVIDMLGRVLLNLKINDMQGTANLDCSQYTAGQYIVVLKENGLVVGNSKLIVE